MRWDIREKLIKVAKHKKTICFGELGSEFGINVRHVGKIVGEISLFESQHCRPLLSAVVVRRDTGMPGKGFWGGPTYEERFSKTGVSKRDFWECQLNKVYEWWERHDP